MTQERLKEIAERAEKATPGPWVNDGADRFSDEEPWVHVIDAPSLLILAQVPCDFPDEQAHDDHLNQCGHAPNNAAFIAHARTDIPDLLAHISTLESELQQVRVERDGLRKACSRIERWFGEFPQVPEKGHMVSYVVAYGSNGERDFMRAIARAALAPAPAARTEEPL